MRRQHVQHLRVPRYLIYTLVSDYRHLLQQEKYGLKELFYSDLTFVWVCFAFISISFESDQLNNILKVTINANTAVSSNDGSKIVCNRSAAIKKSSAIRSPLNILVTISRTCTWR